MNARLLSLAIIPMLVGCTPLRAPSALNPLSANVDRCDSLSDRQVAWAAVAGGAGLLAGASGLPSMAFSDQGARTAMGITALVLGATAAAATIVSQQSGATWSREGCGK